MFRPEMDIKQKKILSSKRVAAAAPGFARPGKFHTA